MIVPTASISALLLILSTCRSTLGFPSSPLLIDDASYSEEDSEPEPFTMEGSEEKMDTIHAGRKLVFENQGRGKWENLFDMHVIPIHSMIVPPGDKVLVYGTNTDGKNHEAGGTKIYYEVWDLEKGVEQDDAHELMDHTNVVDIFCSQMNVDPSTGNVIIIGGDDRMREGVKIVMEYNFKTGKIRKHPKGNMRYARWYPTSINLPNGDIFVIGGSDEHGLGSAIPELWSPETGFHRLKGAKVPIIASEPTRNNWWYPHTYVNSKGEIIVIMPRNTDSKKANVYRVSVEGDGDIELIGEKPFKAHVRSPSIMFQTDLVLMLADSGRLYVADISDGSSPKWEKKVKLRNGRTNGSMMMLPDGRVAIVGGCKTTEDGGKILDKAAKYIEIWDPNTNTVIEGKKEQRSRLYHSTSLVLPDGRLFSGGGGTPGPERNLNGQLFSPGYLFDEDQKKVRRSRIVDCPSNIESGDRFVIKVDDTSRITNVTATKSGSSTHTRNCDTRWLNLDFDVLNGRKLRIHAEDENIMIGGLWMLTVLDDNGVPSEASIIGVNMVALD